MQVVTAKRLLFCADDDKREWLLGRLRESWDFFCSFEYNRWQGRYYVQPQLMYANGKMPLNTG
ncbi:hypothetical protein PICMEDRAFT_60627 [Pichia membranifaciens NRRL Y-2026]|uniref:Uncharacterized protein n=1 Tax=Pichia membranifaciens NRRL Y-2026 TaxID=763406 RepID=A0A1E3NDF8_9ASCO|nr:hypothetical protein PICMEDRAFT_60627 [Pichia membranifaciens NRRL Y-2026]ODQ44159.1 hypothetical protein PICMEDRAFT_60627 [Pichia membranifaciens NRRL Y-2026]